MKAYLAKDKKGTVHLFVEKPKKYSTHWSVEKNTLLSTSDYIKKDLPKDIKPKWSDTEPIEVEIEIKLKK